jgi:lipoprotein-anchoring transpeptidase ErfK/SrfK
MAPVIDPAYSERVDAGIAIPAVDGGYLTERNRRTVVPYIAGDPAGTIVVDPYARVLYYVNGDGTAMRYGIAVGREGRGFRGDASIRRKEVWPSWQPTANMIRTDPDIYGPYAAGLPGGLDNPLGARALYLYRGGADTRYRIHGTNNSSTIGRATSAGCIRLFNQDAIDLFDRTELGAYVHVRSLEESIAIEGEMFEDAAGYMQPLASYPEEAQALIRAGLQPWPKFEPIIGVNALAPVVPALSDGTIPEVPGA